MIPDSTNAFCTISECLSSCKIKKKIDNKRSKYSSSKIKNNIDIKRYKYICCSRFDQMRISEVTVADLTLLLLAYLLAVHCWFVSGVIPLLPNCICCPAEETGFTAANLGTCNGSEYRLKNLRNLCCKWLQTPFQVKSLPHSLLGKSSFYFPLTPSAKKRLQLND